VEILKKYLADSEMTQAEFALAINVSQPTVSDWINGKMRPTVDSLLTISRVTGLSLAKLVADFEKEVA
jgi:transcriptional regulator with XRE-family HTH domain